MIKLKPRLLSICDEIEANSKVIDVGCDHALLDIYLTKYKSCTCLAIDKSINCTLRAYENSLKYNANLLIKCNDGLKDIKLNDEVIVISGMGTKTIKKILDIDLSNTLIISTHTDVDELKEFLHKKNYKIIIEKEIYDRRKYKIIKATK